MVWFSEKVSNQSRNTVRSRAAKRYALACDWAVVPHASEDASTEMDVAPAVRTSISPACCEQVALLEVISQLSFIMLVHWGSCALTPRSPRST